MSAQKQPDDKQGSEDKKVIEQEEREQMLNAENKAQEEQDVEKGDGKLDIKEGREVKPKKIPIGGIQMPGFFTRTKSKEKCKEDEEVVVEGAEFEEVPIETNIPMTQTRIKLPNPFRKSKAITDEEAEKANEQAKDRKKLLDTIRLPLVSVFPRKKKEPDTLENQTGAAGLASMETLDEEKNDKNPDELKQVALEKKDIEKQEEEETTWKQKLKAYRVAVSALLVFILLSIIVIAIAIPGSKNDENGIPIRDGKYIKTITTCGPVEGILDDGAVAFRGIPYARPPVGDLRFKYAQPLNNIDYCWNGTLMAHNATETCLQIYDNGTTAGVEDCLTLDVVTPYVRYENPLPVIVLIGADSFIGGSPGKMRPSARYARSKDVVFVRPNFRLGVLGFLALDALSKNDYPEISGNYGLSDLLMALRWVQFNIQHFGGDKDAVTIFGHKAGATLVEVLTTYWDDTSYFSRAWATSGGTIFPNRTLNMSEFENKSFLSIINCQDAACLLSKDPELLTNMVEDVWRKPQPDLPTMEENPENRHQWLVIDGKILQKDPRYVFSDGALSTKLVLGTTAHVGASMKLLNKHKQWTEELVTEHIKNSIFGSKNLTQEVLNRYPASYKGLSSIISDIRTVCPLLDLSKQMFKVPFYVVTQTRGAEDIADADSDVDAILGRYEPKTPEQRRYVSAMQQLFYHYVWHGEIKQSTVPDTKVLVVDQDVLPEQNYSHCEFLMSNNIVPRYAALD